MRRLARALSAALALAAGSAIASPAAVSTELVRLATVDGQETAGLVYAPGGPVPRAGVVLVHGYGANFYAAVPAGLARGLAGRGFLALSVNLRDHDTGPKTTLFEATRYDLSAAVDELARRGVWPLALVGHSLGTNAVLHYQAATGDPRVRAVVLVAGPGNAFEWNVRLFGRERASADLEAARRLRAAGRGRELMLVDLGPLGKALYSADHLVSLRGPDTRSDPYRNLAQVALPVLVVQGLADRLVDPAVAPRLRAAATAAPRADLVELGGADHGFTRHRDELVGVLERWLAQALDR